MVNLNTDKRHNQGDIFITDTTWTLFWELAPYLRSLGTTEEVYMLRFARPILIPENHDSAWREFIRSEVTIPSEIIPKYPTKTHA